MQVGGDKGLAFGNHLPDLDPVAFLNQDDCRCAQMLRGKEHGLFGDWKFFYFSVMRQFVLFGMNPSFAKSLHFYYVF